MENEYKPTSVSHPIEALKEFIADKGNFDDLTLSFFKSRIDEYVGYISEKRLSDYEKQLTIPKEPTKLKARCCDNEQMRQIGRAMQIAVAQKRTVRTNYERDFAEYVCWIIIIDE